ncbi:hypothetical protein GCM10023346_04070 [Arthrobacter gyeryongensis]|uniref:4Fe-4S Wbl-type domain-containing protein n=1 Tax=Arthrobacter gyeryongensis TaxID=1650592 RepID=A0ABP9S0R9_9MICC
MAGSSRTNSASRSTKSAPTLLVAARAQRKDLATLEDLDCVSCDQFDCPSQLDEPQAPLRGRWAGLDEKHPGEVLNHMQQGRLRADSLTPATAGKEGTNVTNEVGRCSATKMFTNRPEPA